MAAGHSSASATGKPKVMCLRHLDMDIAAVIEENKAEVEGNRRAIAWSVDQIEEECKQINSMDYRLCYY